MRMDQVCACYSHVDRPLGGWLNSWLFSGFQTQVAKDQFSRSEINNFKSQKQQNQLFAKFYHKSLFVFLLKTMAFFIYKKGLIAE